MTHLLDSSAWLTHLFAEPGFEQVNHLFDDPGCEVYVSALSIPEVYARLKALGRQAHWPEVWEAYAPLFTKVLSADEPVAHEAVRLRAATAERLPTIDGLIAATAVIHQLILVHHDPHLAAIPAQLLRQMQLPSEKR